MGHYLSEMCCQKCGELLNCKCWNPTEREKPLDEYLEIWYNGIYKVLDERDKKEFSSIAAPYNRIN